MATQRRRFGPTRPPHSNVRSEALESRDETKDAPQRKPQTSLYALAIVLLVFGGIGWIAGGKYTVEGWVIALNMFARWIGIEQQLSIPRGWWLVGAVVVSGVIYSRVELLALRNTVQRMPTFWISWVLIFLTDVGSTFFGVVNPAPDAAPVFYQIATLWPLAVAWALILTLMPEYLILGAIRLFKR